MVYKGILSTGGYTRSASLPLRSPGNSDVIHSSVGLAVSHDTLRYTMLRDVTNLALNKRSKKTVDGTKYKTEMCRNWVELGQCQYGQKCNFAHGYEDLQDKVPANSKYKSKLCIPFHEKGYCTYGQRCLFLHSHLQLQDMDKPYQWTLLLLGRQGRRLPIFKRLAPETELQEAARIEGEAARYLERLVSEDLELTWEYKSPFH